jgi:hypothetical protein
MFGTDLSATWRWVREPADLYTLRLRVIEAAGLTDEERADVLWRSATRFYELPVVAPTGERTTAGTSSARPRAME